MSKLKIKARGISMEVVGKDNLIQREREAFLDYAENHSGIKIGATAIPVEGLKPFPEHMNCKCNCDNEESAEEICEKKGFETEYRAWRKEKLGTEEMRLYRDFLAEVKGYCLIHNPSGTGGYIVTNIKELTKKQREFLFDYFMDMGDRFKAEQFWEE